ncbi:MAG: nucleotidyltransferase domain-containing protein [Actinobacteria bacterium]|nr:nucleotidyltransferase domain-containing protein [Actinomycetota bacterium]
MSRTHQTVGVLDTLAERKYLHRLLQALPPEQPVLLVGSWARGTVVSRWSDIDVLVLGERPPDLAPPRLQVIVIGPEEFKERVMAGDDFAQWALRLGVPLGGRRTWEDLQSELLKEAPWPDPARKLEQAGRKLEAAASLLDMGDIPAGEEEIRFALSHLARAELLSRRLFPLSRPELVGQLEEAGIPDLAAMMRRANSRDPMSKEEVRRAVEFVGRRLAAQGRPATGRQGS